MKLFYKESIILLLILLWSIFKNKLMISYLISFVLLISYIFLFLRYCTKFGEKYLKNWNKIIYGTKY
jgi:hypothetical protein